MSYKILSIENYPEVNINLFPRNVEETQQWLKEMDDLFTKDVRFVLVYPQFDLSAFASIDEKISQESRKNVISWLKKNRDIFIEKCRGIILTLNHDQSDLSIIQKQKPQLEAVYRVPVRILYNDEERSTVADSLLAY